MALTQIHNQSIDGGARLENWNRELLPSPDQYQENLPSLLIYYPDSGAPNPVPSLSKGVVTIAQKDAKAPTGALTKIAYSDIIPGSVVTRTSDNAVKQVVTVALPATLTATMPDNKGAFVSIVIESPEGWNQTPETNKQYQIYVPDVATYTATAVRDALLLKLQQDPNAMYVAAASSTNAITLTDANFNFTNRYRITSTENATVALTTARKYDTYKAGQFKSSKLPPEILAAETNPAKTLSAIEFKYWAHHRQTQVLGGGSGPSTDNAVYEQQIVSATILFDPNTVSSQNAFTALQSILNGAAITAATDTTALKAAVLPYIALL